MSKDPGSDSTWDEIRAWRKVQRARLVGQRAACSQEQRKAWNDRITEHLAAAFDIPCDAVVGFCWPYKGEFDARFAIRHWREHGAVAALPEVVDSKAPLRFSKWWPGAPMRPGVYDIPVPDGTEVVVPDVAVVPMNAFDDARLPSRLRRRFLRSDTRRVRAPDSCDRRQLRAFARANDLSAAARYSDGLRGHRSRGLCGRR